MPAPTPTIETYMNDGSNNFTIAEADRKYIPVWLRAAWDQVYTDLVAEGLSNVTFTDRTSSANPENGYEYFPGWLKDKLDDDAPKKAITDGLTKAISHLGFNADVFLGKFDGNKYTQNEKGKANDAGW